MFNSLKYTHFTKYFFIVIFPTYVKNLDLFNIVYGRNHTQMAKIEIIIKKQTSPNENPDLFTWIPTPKRFPYKVEISAKPLS